jgi:LacI family transcriptional regulator
LAESDLKLETIAERCGFRHGEYLGAVFRSEFGQTPGEFRAQLRMSAHKTNGS